MGTSSVAERSEPQSEGGATVGAARDALTHRLMDSLLHDARNPLNALSINLDVLTEKLRREQGEIPASQEKNLKVMREQIFRVDGILKQFSEFIVPRADAASSCDFSDTVKQVLVVLGHECRRAMIKVRQMVEPDLRVEGSTPSLRFIALQAVFRAIARAGNEGEIDVTLQRDGSRALLRVKDGCADAREPFTHAVSALESSCAEVGAELRVSGNEVQVLLSLA